MTETWNGMSVRARSIALSTGFLVLFPTRPPFTPFNRERWQEVLFDPGKLEDFMLACDNEAIPESERGELIKPLPGTPGAPGFGYNAPEWLKKACGE